MKLIFSTKELLTLLRLSELTCADRSPLKTLAALELRDRDSVPTLTQNGLCDENGILTPDGAVLATLLMTPESVVLLGLHSVAGGAHYALRCGELWCVYCFSSAADTHTLWAYFDTPTLAEWLPQRLYGTYVSEQAPETVLNTELSPAEWQILQLAQCFLRLRTPHSTFRKEDLFSADVRLYLKNGLTDVGYPETADGLIALERDSDSLLQSLKEKGILDCTESEWFQTTVTLEHLDAAGLIDTLYFRRTEDGLDYTVLFALRRCGITALVDLDAGVRMISAAAIPWKHYLH